MQVFGIFVVHNLLQLFRSFSHRVDHQLQETKDDVRFVTLPHGFEQNLAVSPNQRKQRLDGVNWDHPQDPYDVLLNVGVVEVQQVLPNFVGGDGKSQEDKDGRHVPGDVVELRREDRVPQDNGGDDEKD